jgi:hypothetical protein
LSIPQKSCQPEEEEVGLGPARRRTGDDADHRAIGGIDTAALEPLREGEIRRAPGGRSLERGTLKEREVVLHPVDDADLIPVLKILADAGQVDPHGNAEAREMVQAARGPPPAPEPTMMSSQSNCSGLVT